MRMSPESHSVSRSYRLPAATLRAKVRRKSMKAVRFHQYGDLDVLRYEDELIDGGELRVEVARRVLPAELPALHADAAAGVLPGGKVVVAAGA